MHLSHLRQEKRKEHNYNIHCIWQEKMANIISRTGREKGNVISRARGEKCTYNIQGRRKCT